jgi:hypothetical protein
MTASHGNGTTARELSVNWGEALVCFAVAAVFIAFGLGASWMLGRTLYDGYRARDWVPAQAAVDAFGRGTVSYHYEFGGVRHFGDRLGVAPVPVSGNLDSWNDDMTAVLAPAFRTGKPITVWVNAADPGESIVNRDVRWGVALMMAPVVVASWVLGIVMLWVTLRRISGSPEYGHDERSPAPFWIIAIIGNATAIPVAIVLLHRAVSGRDVWSAIASVACLVVAAALLRFAVRASAARRRLGPTDPVELKARVARERAAAARLARLREPFPSWFFVICAAVIVAVYVLMMWIRATGRG